MKANRSFRRLFFSSLCRSLTLISSSSSLPPSLPPLRRHPSVPDRRGASFPNPDSSKEGRAGGRSRGGGGLLSVQHDQVGREGGREGGREKGSKT